MDGIKGGGVGGERSPPPPPRFADKMIRITAASVDGLAKKKVGGGECRDHGKYVDDLKR